MSWVARVRALIVDAEDRVLLLDEGDGYALPRVEVGFTDEELPAIRAALAELVGVDAITLRSIERSVDEERKILELALEVEPLAVSPTSASQPVWRFAADSEGLPLSESDRSLIELHRADRPPPERPQWTRRGWFAEASAWIHEVLGECGRSAVGPVEQISNWCISSILRTETDDGTAFFKATARSPLFVDEGTVTRGLAAMFPGRVPRPIAVEPERRWMLLDDFGPVVGWKADLETRVAVLAAFGRVQREAASRQDELLALGVLDRRPAWLASEIESLLSSPEALGLDDAEAKELAERASWFGEACERLAAGAVPDSLVHGDLHLANVAGTSGQFVFFDWTDACLTHPFLDLLVVLFEEDRELQRSLRDAYLGVWAEVAPEQQLLELWGLAAPLACLNQVISYSSIMASVEHGSAPELSSMPAYWLRKALASADTRS